MLIQTCEPYASQAELISLGMKSLEINIVVSQDATIAH